MSADPIDYSRPVGWWCAYCGYGTVGAFHTVMCPHPGVHIPRFLPLPTPEPVEVDEVETGEAEVVTLSDSHQPEAVWYASNETVLVDFEFVSIRNGLSVPTNLERWGHKEWLLYLTNHINRIAAASANERKKREEAK
jgi:hypothetical protein